MKLLPVLQCCYEIDARVVATKKYEDAKNYNICLRKHFFSTVSQYFFVDPCLRLLLCYPDWFK